MRPFGVTILAILGFIGAILLFVSAAFFAAFGQMILAMAPQDVETAGPFLALFMTVGGIVFAVFGVVAAVVSYGLWKGASWAWWIYIILLALGILSSLTALPIGIVGIVINLIIIYYLTRPHVKEYFGV